jgi:uncharacterized membrane protein
MPDSQLKAGARKLIFENAPKLFYISLIYVFIAATISSLSFRLPGTLADQSELGNRIMSGDISGFDMIYTTFRPIGAILAILLYLLQPVIDAGFMSYCMRINRKQDGEYKDVFNGFIYFTKVIAIFFISSVLIFLWSLLFIFPGIVAHYKYRQAYYILLDEPKKSALQCISESKLLMHGKKLDLFILDLSFLGWFLLDIIVVMLIPLPFTIPIVSIWLSPYIGLTRAAFYENQLTTVTV